MVLLFSFLGKPGGEPRQRTRTGVNLQQFHSRLPAIKTYSCNVASLHARGQVSITPLLPPGESASDR